MSVGNFYENAVLDAMYGSGHTSRFPATVYLAVFQASSPPNDAGGGTELALARKAVTNNSTNFPDASGSLKENGTQIKFAAASSDLPAAGYWAFFDAASGGHIVSYGRMADTISVSTGEQLTFEPGSIVIPCD